MKFSRSPPEEGLEQTISEANERFMDVNAQNWQTIPRIVVALRRLGVPAAMILDLDAVFHPDSRAVFSAAGVPEEIMLGLGQTRGQILSKVKDLDLPGDKKGNRSKNDVIKHFGLNAFPAEQQVAVAKYLRDLAEWGIFAVPVGELEGWFPEFGISRVKKEWIVRMFERMGSDPTALHFVAPASDGPWKFLRDVARWILDPQRLGMPDPVLSDAAPCPH